MTAGSEPGLRILPDRWGTAVGPLSDEAFEGEVLPAGQVGVIVVAGDHVLRGYLDVGGQAVRPVPAGSPPQRRPAGARREARPA